MNFTRSGSLSRKLLPFLLTLLWMGPAWLHSQDTNRTATQSPTKKEAKKNRVQTQTNARPDRSPPTALEEDTEYPVDLAPNAEKSSQWTPTFSGEGLLVLRFDSDRPTLFLGLKNSQGQFTATNTVLPENASGAYIIHRLKKGEVYQAVVKNLSTASPASFHLSVRKWDKDAARLVPQYGVTSELIRVLSNADSAMMKGAALKDMREWYKQIETLLEKAKGHPNLDNLKKDFSELKANQGYVKEILKAQALTNQIATLFTRFNQSATKAKSVPLAPPEWKNEMTLVQIQESTTQVRKAIPYLSELATSLKELLITVNAFIDTNQGQGNDDLLEQTVFRLEEIPSIAVARKANLSALQKHVDQISQVAYNRMIFFDSQLGNMYKRYSREFAATVSGEMREIVLKAGAPAEIRPGKRKGTVEWHYDRSRDNLQEETVLLFDEKSGKLLRRMKPGEGD